MNKVYTIDHGNNQCCMGLFSAGKLEKVDTYSKTSLPNDKSSIIYSSVGKAMSFPGQNAGAFFKDGRFLSMPVHYGQTLGTDRLVLAHYFYDKEKTPPTVIIDAGSFITVDLVDDKGFMGGIILPGLDIYLKNFSQAARLPTISKEKLPTSPTSLKANSTENAIMGGLNLILEKILKEEIEKIHPEKIFWTGGDGKLLHSLFKKGTFIPHLIHLGLYKIHKAVLKRV